MTTITTITQLEEIYGAPSETAVAKQLGHVSDHYRALIEASPFAVLATSGPEGLDCSPRGDRPGFVEVADPHTLMLPDRRGNNRVDSLRNVVADPRIALLFLLPGSGTTLRVNGRARISIDPALLERFAVNGQPPRSVLIVAVQAVYFQCSRAILRSGLWEAERHCDPDRLPSPGDILASITAGRVGGPEYDRQWPDRARKALW